MSWHCNICEKQWKHTSKTVSVANGHSSVFTNAEHSALTGEYLHKTTTNGMSHQQLLELRHRLPSVIDIQAIRVHRRCPAKLKMTWRVAAGSRTISSKSNMVIAMLITLGKWLKHRRINIYWNIRTTAIEHEVQMSLTMYDTTDRCHQNGKDHNHGVKIIAATEIKMTATRST